MEHSQKKEKIVVIIGPTAVGKTKLSIALAKKLNGEIISGDSMQVYKGLDIGTAKIKREEMEGIPHYLIDIKQPDESFSVAEFQELVKKHITDISMKEKLPIIVGGTGLYIQSVIYDYQFTHIPSSDQTIRERLEKKALEEGNHALYAELKQIDPNSAEKIHPNNVRRVIRALEVYYCTGKTMSELQKQEQELCYDAALIGLTMKRDELYRRINKRVDQMMEEGLLDEVRNLYESGLTEDCQSIQGIGYKELYEYFSGKVTLEEAVEKLKLNSRRYAKRQLTWFRNKMPVKWFDMTKVKSSQDFQEIFSEISSYIEGKLEIKSNT